MAGSQVITVTGPVACRALGVVDAHDHLFIDSPGMPGQGVHRRRAVDRGGPRRRRGRDQDDRRDDADRARAGPGGAARDQPRPRASSSIAASGFHRDAHYPAGHVGLRRAGRAARATGSSRTSRVGMHPADWHDPSLPLDAARAGAIKGGASYHHISARRAAPARGHRRRLGRDRRRGPRPHRDRDGGPRDRRPPGRRGRDDRPDRARPPRPEPGLGAPRRGRRARRHARVRHRSAAPSTTRTASCSTCIERVAGAGHLDRLVLGLDLGRPRLPPRLRRRARAALPHDGRSSRGCGGGWATRRSTGSSSPTRPRLYAHPWSRARMKRPLRRRRRRVRRRRARRRRSRRPALGARTLLVDRLAFMGGTSTAVLDTFYAFYTPGERSAPGGRRAGLGGRAPADRGRASRSSARTRTARGPASRTTWRRSRSCGSAWRRTRASSSCSTPGRRASARRGRAAHARSGCGTRAASAGSRRPSSSTRPATRTWPRWPASRTTRPSDGTTIQSAVDAVQGRERGRRARRRPCPRPSCGR